MASITFDRFIEEIKKDEERAVLSKLDPSCCPPINFSVDFTPSEYDEWTIQDILHNYKSFVRIAKLQNIISPLVKEEKEVSVQEAIEEKEVSEETKELELHVEDAVDLVHQTPVITIPEFLKEDPLKKAEEDVEKKLLSGKFSKQNPKEIRAQMVELTKKLFKEQNNAKRRKIKEEINMLRALLSKLKDKNVGNAVFEILLKQQREEIKNAKETVLRSWRRALESVLNTYFSIKDDPKSKELLLKDIDVLFEQTDSLINSYVSFLSKKHGEEWEIIAKRLNVSKQESPPLSSLTLLKDMFREKSDVIKHMSDGQLLKFLELLKKDNVHDLAALHPRGKEILEKYEKGEIRKEEALFFLRWSVLNELRSGDKRVG